MKIVKHGRPIKRQQWIGTCRSCESIVVCERQELTNIDSCPREHYEFCWMKCPVCSTDKAICFHVDKENTETKFVQVSDIEYNSLIESKRLLECLKKVGVEKEICYRLAKDLISKGFC